MKEKAISGVIIVIVLATTIGVTPILLVLLQQSASAMAPRVMSVGYSDPRASIATSNNNVYVTWWDNRTGNWEVLFTKSSDNGKSFSDTINISNSSDARSLGARMAAQGNNVYITWWDTDKSTGVKNVFFRASNDNGNTFGSAI